MIPFDTRDAAGAPSMLGDAVADELISALSRNADLTVISRLSTTVLRGRSDALLGARHLLKADYTLAGSMHVADDQLRAVLELTRSRHLARRLVAQREGQRARRVQRQRPAGRRG